MPRGSHRGAGGRGTSQIEQDSQAIVHIRLDEMELHRARQWGGCWLACELYHQLELEQFFSQRLA
jgi:hypothetical protein